MTTSSVKIDTETLEAYGIHGITEQGLLEIVRIVLSEHQPAIYPQAGEELTAVERKVIADGGIDLDEPIGVDPVAKGAARFAALIATSLAPKEVAERLGVLPGKVRQMIARRSLYSVKLDDRRFVPLFQFRADGSLVPNIAQVNAALPVTLHPVRVAEWYSTTDADLCLESGQGPGMTPLQWLDSGGDACQVVAIAREL